MTGIFSVVSDYHAGMFRLNQAARPWDDDGKASSLAEKLDVAQQAFQLDPAFVRGAQAAKTAMEEAMRIGGPKAAAQDRLTRAEQRLKQIQQEVRLAQARGDRQKLAALAQEAAQLARQAGRAAKEYASGIAAAASMGVGGDPALTAGGSSTTTGMLAAASSTTVSVSTTTVQIRQIELSLSLTVRNTPEAAGAATAGAAGAVGEGQTGDGATGDGATGDGATGGAPTTTVTLSTSLQASSVDASSDSVTVTAGNHGDDLLKRLGLPSSIKLDGLPQAVRAGLAVSGQPIGGFSGAAGRNLLNAMIQDNDAKASRYKEADTFARRVEGVINGVKSIIGQAKAANLGEPDEKQRTQRRKMLEELEKTIDEARENANDLRAAAYGSSDSVNQRVTDTLTGNGKDASAGTGTATDTDGNAGSLAAILSGFGASDAVDSGSGVTVADTGTSANVASLPSIDITA